jgi:hypothetical protein
LKIYKTSSDPGKGRRFAYAVNIDSDTLVEIDCKVCNNKWNKKLLYDKNVKSPILISNKPLPDFMFYYVGLISERAKNIFEEEGITGYELEKAVVKSFDNLSEEEELYCKEMKYKRKDFLDNPPNYYKLFTDVGAEIHEKAKLKLLEKCDVCGHLYYEFNNPEGWRFTPASLTIKKDSVTNDDLFKVIGYGGEFCSEKFKKVYDKYKLTGLNFEEVELI